MQRKMTFTILETPDDQFDVTALVDVPIGWDDMTEDEQREYLIRPVGAHMHPGQILYNSSRFQLATGMYDEIWDFQFCLA